MTAQTLAGSWTGTWKNLRFKTARGTFTIVISAPDDSTIVIDASQADFGCGALATPVTLVAAWLPVRALGRIDPALVFRV